ncbi:MAG TPA: tRNA pseudouridine(38-40) synthase TruA [Terriglobia bacterium]|nr:tRNA pseudouridine(38-40) synthase TruA [Terriglobia bacterium]
MITLKAVLEYDGTRYSGWQEQKNARTVLGEVRKAVEEVLGARVELMGSGRTDAGVHALGQVMHIKLVSGLAGGAAGGLENARRKLNERLPADIAILSVEPAPRSFHARHDAIARTYLYQISKRKQAFTKRFVWWVKDDLDVSAMERAAATLVGRHDFACFREKDHSRQEESTVVVVYRSEIETNEDIVQFRIEASHFLWRMARRLVGVLVRIGTGAMQEQDLVRLLTGKPDPAFEVAAWTAPASGLFLETVRYE